MFARFELPYAVTHVGGIYPTCEKRNWTDRNACREFDSENTED